MAIGEDLAAAALAGMNGAPEQGPGLELAPEEETAPYDYAEKFWLLYPPYSMEFAEEVLRRFQDNLKVWKNSALGWTVWQAYRAYHNINAGPDANAPMTQLMAAGEMGELLAMAIPHYRSLVKHQISMFTAERPAWDPIARTSDSAAGKQVPMASALLEHVGADGVLDSRLQEQVEIMLTAGSAYYVTGWDVHVGLNGQGWFTERVFAPWEMVHENVRHYEDARWWIFRGRESRWDWVAFYAKEDPEKARAIAEHDAGEDVLLENDYVDRNDTLYGSDNDRISVLHIMAKPSLACPTGRYAMVLSEDIVLLDGPYPYGDQVTISRMCASEFLGTSLPYSDSWGALAAAEAYNAILSMLITRVDTCGVPNFYTEQGSEISFQDIASGNNVWEIPSGAKPPGVVDMLQGTPPWLTDMLEFLKSEMDATGGINSVTRGQPAENVSSGSMAALMQTMALQFNSNLERAWVLNLERVGTHHLKVFQAMATEPQAISVCGKDNKWTSKEFRGEDLSQIMRVAVKTASALSKTKGGRAQIAEVLFQKEKIEPEEYMQVVQTGQLDRLFMGPVGKMNLIKAENEKLADGIPVEPLLWEDHVLHVREHMALLTTDARNDPAIVQLVFEHCNGHYKLMQDMSLQDPDRLALMGLPPLPAALAIHQQTQAMQSMAMGMPPPPPADHGPGPKQAIQPNSEEGKAAPGPKAAPPGQEPSATSPDENPKQPEPSKSPMDGTKVA